MDNLPSKCVDKGIVFSFRISDNNVILRDKKSIGNFPFGRKRFSGTGRTKNQSVRIFQFLPVHHDHVVGKGVQTVIQRFSRHEQFLCGKWHKNSSGRGC